MSDTQDKTTNQGSPTHADLLRAAMDVVAEHRPNHEHYDDPRECSLCRLFALLDFPDERAQMRDWDAEAVDAERARFRAGVEALKYERGCQHREARIAGDAHEADRMAAKIAAFDDVLALIDGGETRCQGCGGEAGGGDDDDAS